MSGYAVIDLETTGFAYKTTDRICEIAVVLVDAEGQREHSYSTLVNPQRDLGAQHIHGIDATDSRVAPTFDRVVGDLTELFVGRTVVAHNAAFDVRFLAAEYHRVGVPVALEPGHAVCTMQLARQLGLPPKLGDVCGYFGIPLVGAHAALNDAEATAKLLTRYREYDTVARAWQQLAIAGERFAWPVTPALKTPAVPRGAAQPGSGLLESIVASFHPTVKNGDERAYLEVLDRVLLDRKISAQERRELDDAANRLSISAQDRERLHRTYMLGIVDIACEDKVLTPYEKAHIVNLAGLLQLDDVETEALVAHAHTQADASSTTLDLPPGSLIVLTGFPAAEKARLTQLAEGRGLVVWSGVKKGVAAVVAQDPGSSSGKATRARSMGIPVVGADALG